MSGDANGQQTLSLPQGGGAISGIGETFKADLFSGTGSFSVPIFTSPARGLTPSLNLAYSSGSGNGPFGLGWQLSIPRVTRKTEKGLPRYDDRDTFVMSGAEDLVPVPDPPLTCGAFAITRYRPRTEGQFARIERWVSSDGDTHWRAITPNNVTSIYGRTPNARITDPDNPRRVYEWLLQETFDAKGNHVLYEYAHEDAATVPASLSERNRTYNQLYIRRIFYGNSHEIIGPRKRGIDHANPLVEIERSYLMELFFDYGDLQDGTPVYSDQPERVTGAWALRADPFSTYRAGFEVRTLRLCQRVVMFHHFSELGGATRVKSTDLAYSVDPNTQIAFLTSATVTSYRREGSSYRTASLPPVTFQYSQFRPHEQRYQSVAVEGDLLPASLNSPQMSLVDLFGKGLPDVLETTPGGFRYWRNLGGGRFARPRMMANAPSAITLDQPDVRFADMSGNGRADLLVLNDEIHGFYETDGCGGWQPFKPIPHMPSFNLADPNARLLDLTGDGLTDVLVTSDRHFLWFECLGEEGYAAPRAVPRVHDLDQFPDVYFDDPSGRVQLADMNGDGMADIVLLHNGRVDYWPNLGHGRFGRRITMANAPRLGLQSNFDPARLHLADVDGEGCADLVYVDRDCVRLWFNCSGNGWSAENVIPGTPSVTDQASVEFVDLFGTGTATLVWSYDLAYQPGGNYKALDFCAGIKPYLLTEMSNNMGMTTRATYTSSTQFYLEDEANREPWLTRLPFPVHVLARIESFDHISQIKSVVTYKYHHGYYDGREREFRGFGRVDQFDTVAHDDFMGGPPAVNGQAPYYVPPVETRTWFHTGIYFDTTGAGDVFDYEDLAARYRQAYYQGDPYAFTLGEHTVEMGATPHRAYRTLRGAILRTEVYSHDGTPRAAHPYQVTEQRYHVRMVQPQDGAHPPVYLTIPAESLSYQYERKPNDPRTSHEIVLNVDPYGNTTDSVTIHYPRRAPLLPEQAGLKSVYTHTDFINQPDPAAYHIGVPFQTRTYEITGVSQPTPATLLRASHFAVITSDPGNFLPYHAEPGGTAPEKRLIEWKRVYFRVDAEPDLLDAPGNLAHRLPLGQIDPLGLPYETYGAALTDAHIALVYSSPALVTPAILQEGGYRQEADVPGYWWFPGVRQAFDPNAFYAPVRSQDPFGAISRTVYDRYDLLAERTIDPLGNVVQGANDYRTLQPYQVTDINGNITQVAFDTLGLVAGMAALGKGQEGDSLANFSADITQEQLDAVYQTGGDVSLLGSATTRHVYDLHAYRLRGKPTLTLAINRETHQAHLATGQTTRIQRQVTYTDGSGRPVLTKAQAEPGEVNGVYTENRWIGTGFTIYNNKGQPVRKYEPFFSNTHQYEYGRQVGVSDTSFYDPIGRVIAALHPNHTWEKVVFDPWRQETWDLNDTVLMADPKTDADVGYFFGRLANAEYLPTWHTLRTDAAHAADLAARYPDAADRTNETQAAHRTEVHAGTPTIAHVDSLGRTFLTVAHNKAKYSDTPPADPPVEEFDSTRIILDIEGNQRKVMDAKNRVVMRYDYDMLGNRVHQASMEAGERWILNDVAGKPLYAWDSRSYSFRTAHDPLRRPTDSFLRESGGAEMLVGRTVYGETQPSPEAKNLRGKVFQVFDQAGVVTSDLYDFKGNLLHSQRRLAQAYKTTLNWSGTVPLEAETYTSRTRYDALNRPIQLIAPHSDQSGATVNVIQPICNEANLLEQVHIWLNQGAEPGNLLNPATANLHAVTNIDYDAKGQRLLINYGNGVRTTYTYDPLTFRLTHLLTRRNAATFPGDCPQPPPAGWPGCQAQNLHYTYDPAGNITHIRDDAQQTIYFRNRRVEPSAEYTYDALYRLIEANGREHLGQVGGAPIPHSYNDARRVRLLHPSDGNAMGRYLERYVYDAVGNFLSMQHRGTDPAHPGWMRSYAYNETSQLEPGKQSNRLTSTTIGGTTETYSSAGNGYDAHGSMLRMPHLQVMQWDFRDLLRMTQRQAVNAADADGVLHQGERTWYVYDLAGQRVRKVTEHANGQVKDQRVYLGGFEIYRKNGTNLLVRETLHIMDDKQRVALVETRTQGDEPGVPQQLTRYQFGNHLGSASLELDAQAQIISYEEYTPYGSTSYQAVRSQTETPKRYRYTGKERDEESGLYYHGARCYAPWLCRWLAPDKAGMMDGLNLYAYVRNQPIHLADPSGYAAETDWFEVGEGVRQQHKAEGVPDLKDTRAPLSRSSDFPDYDAARRYGNKQAADFRASQGMSGRSVMGGHCAAARDVMESGISKADWDKAPMQQLQSSLKADPGLSAQVTDPLTGNTETGTRHLLAQEGMIDDAVSRARPPGGRLTPQGQLDAAEEVYWRTQGTGMDQREVVEKRASGLFDEQKALDKSEAVKASRVEKAAKEAKLAKAGSQALESGGKSVVKYLGTKALKVIPFIGISAGVYSMTAEAAQGHYGTAALEAVGLVPVAGDLVDAARLGIAIGEVGSELLGISAVAAEVGDVYEKTAQSLGLGKGASAFVGAYGAALSSITVAPTVAWTRKCMQWFK